MAEALVSLLIEHFGSMALERIEEEVRLVKGVDEDVANLKTNLEDIQAVLEDAEQKQLNDASLKRWLDKLNNATHDIDDVLDEWNTAILEFKIKKEEEAENNASSSNKKVCFPMPSSCFCFTRVKRLTLRRDIALKIKELNQDLDRIAKDKDKYNLNIKRIVERPEHRQTTFLIDETKVQGRDEDKSLLISKLLSESSDDGRRLDIIPIVGMGGLGKTTLAQLAYNDETIKTHFDKRIWVCVSDPFEEVKIAKAIIEGLGSSGPSSVELNALVRCIHESVEGKRFLLVLDDVWLEDYSKWETLHVALQNGAIGSTILVTTRKQEVSIMMGAATHQISLQRLSEEHCWLIFSQLAFMERTTEERAELENIGRQIARKSSGLPLVAKTLGSLMRFRKTISQWEDILRSELWESKDVKVREIFAPFLLSYYDLSPLQKRCFLYCLVFPKDYDIGRDDLIEMWMSQGYLGQTINSKKEGRDCFESLAMRSFFQDFKEDEFHGSIKFNIHDIVHDFAQFLMGSEYVLMEADGIEENKNEVDESTRHLTLVVGSEDHFLTLRHNAKNLRTIYIYSNTDKLHVDRMLLFSHLTRLRTLNLYRCYIESLPEDIGLLKHLRYLDLSGNTNLKELPGTLFNLYNLQTLRLGNCTSLPRLPEKIAKLVNLKNLYIYGCRFEGLPKGISKLTGLLTLDMWVVPKERKTYLDVGDLKMLKFLQFQKFLSIKRCASMGNLDESEKINLSSWQHLLDLTLRFRETSELYEIGEILDADIEILESLQPHPNLKALDISDYLGATVSPTWMMSLTNLTSLELNFCTKCEILPPLGKLPSLVSLVICCLDSLKKVGPEFLGITERDEEDHGIARRDQDTPSEPSIIYFPRLKKLTFDWNEEWKEWEGYRMTTTTPTKIMPCLHSLKITKCHNLETLPDFLQMTPLQNLSVKKSKILQRNVQKVPERNGTRFLMSQTSKLIKSTCRKMVFGFRKTKVTMEKHHQANETRRKQKNGVMKLGSWIHEADNAPAFSASLAYTCPIGRSIIYVCGDSSVVMIFPNDFFLMICQGHVCMFLY